MADILKATYGAPERPLKVADFEIPCYVLENEQRVIVQRGLLKALGMSTGGSKTPGTRKIEEFINKSAIKPFIDNKLALRVTKPIEFLTPNGASATGYEATILVDICDAVLQAKKEGKLPARLQHIADQAEMLIRGFAKTGIIALVDEATGYQTIREKDALRKFLEKFLVEEKGKWVKTFPDEFFEMIFKMKNWTWYVANKGKKPQVVGHYINDFVYARIGPSVLEELRVRTPKNDKGKRTAKFTQYLTTDYGHPKLKEHINSLMILGKASGYSWAGFKKLLNRALPKIGSPMEIDFPDDDLIDGEDEE